MTAVKIYKLISSPLHHNSSSTTISYHILSYLIA